jgi:hypothetical protein
MRTTILQELNPEEGGQTTGVADVSFFSFLLQWSFLSRECIAQRWLADGIFVAEWGSSISGVYALRTH